MTRHCVLITLFTAVTCGDAAAQSQRMRAEVDRSVARGVSNLKLQQRSDGSWHYSGHDVGITALVGLALLESNVPRSDPVIQKAEEYVRDRGPYTLQTYDISLAIMFLSRMGDESNEPIIQLLGNRLAAGQLTSGGWTYTCPERSDRALPDPARLSNSKTETRSKRNSGRIRPNLNLRGNIGDNSNTQFAVLGIWTAGKHGVDVRNEMDLVDRRFRATQNPRGGWGYRNERRDRDAMTCAGLMALVLAKGYKTVKADEARLSNADAKQRAEAGARRKMESDPAIEKGIRLAAKYANEANSGSSLYFLWSVERVGVALRARHIGAVDWFARGSEILLQTQQQNGSWRSVHGELPDTSFALLFLRRANLTEGVPQLLTNRASGAGGNRLRPATLQDLRRSLKRTQAPPHDPPPPEK